jgi:signal transduction histidine kinase
MYTDLTKLRQILLTLMNNAAKFTKQGNIRLETKRDGEWVTFYVIDNGIGMTVERQKKLFEPFTFGSLSLAITQVFVQMLGGTLQVKSEFGHGSTFVLSLPVKAQVT